MTQTKDKIKILLFAIFVGCLCIALILLAADTAKAEYNLSRIESRCDALESEIADLNAQLQSAGNIQLIEAKAFSLGMEYPNYFATVTLTSGENKETDLAETIRSVAYGEE